MRRALLLTAALCACKGGLYTEKGNDFPCDFSQPEGTRDAVCAPGEVCGVDNLCRQYRYEGPQFDNGATAPHFEDALTRHPGVLDRQVSAIGHRFTSEGPKVVAVLGQGTTATVVPLDLTQAITAKPAVPYPSDLGKLTALASPSSTLDTWVVALTHNGPGDDPLFAYDSVALTSPRTLAIPDGERLRSGPQRIHVLRALLDGGTAAVEVTKGSALTLDDALRFSDDGGVVHPLDVRDLPDITGGGDDTLLLTREALALRRRTDAGVVTRLNPDEPMPGAFGLRFPLQVDLRTDGNGTLAAFALGPKSPLVHVGPTILSSWRLDRAVSPSATRLWSDCTPCVRGDIAAFVPVFDEGRPTVEVLCRVPVTAAEEAKGGLQLVRVVGSATANDTQLCIVEAVDAPFDLGQVSRVKNGRRAAELDGGSDVVIDESLGLGVMLGGQRGQIWAGASFTQALPLFLDRIPTAFGALPQADGGLLEAVFTDAYAASPRVEGMGYQVLNLRVGGVDLPKDAVGAAFVGQARGWGLLSSADLVFLDPNAAGGLGVGFGPRLVDARGSPARGPFFGEAATASDAGVVSFVMTADDSVYFLPLPDRTTSTADVLDEVTPQLTPAPSSPIRSFTLERSAVGTNGVDRVRAYLIAGRSLFLVTLDGTPPRWKATPLLLQGGEPIEVWMDHPLGGLGRVGFRDGQVFTLPGGFLLVNPLPLDAGVKPPQVFDYENLGGWPVAMTSNGLFEAHYDVLDGGRLVNRFEDGGINRAMEWRRVTLPDGGEPWLGQTNARLNVRQDTAPFDPSDGVNPGPTGPPPFVKVFHLQVYTAEQVIEVGTLIRK
ncbi:MAG: hypothetical protein IPJ65_01935 [Archangiaceae bacterium]|nr:hypothetical protein [Archangiaceae bacterium]